ncbi:LuxR C-terminal-related transcriptional regulator [Kitasatospora sp. NBC_00240]|uniref:ATP-binding protein n=1 Tax=Kitasatospora sp. NBC_00240 TaxID=2903567 RepID=UPI0022589335|nr:LuxR C-terminal-related transcriptional regulator [Kitasatospora sp. NBC_00240]MCX5208356.1 LuxR C-terminal-related transcriptional regulator [Kitasatospora sp. NBC_00240]
MTTPVRTRWGDAGLPVELTSFVGRRQDIGAVKGALSEARVVTLTGAGGVGKTRLAMRVATELRRAFADGVRFVDLSTATDPAAMRSSVVDALGIHDQSTRDSTDVIADFLRDRQMLLVLDNCEQIAGDCASLVNALIRRSPRIRILATSRERLWVTGEYVWRVPSLSVPDKEGEADGARTSTAPAEYPSLALFAERAAMVGGTSPDREDWPDVAELCRMLDGLPLAIELAAAQTRMFSPAQLVRRFDERLGSLRGLDRAAPPRHRTLEAAIDWSHELCSPAERLLWARASVFAGWFGLDAVEGVCSGEGLPREKVIDTIAGLVDKSVLVPEEHLGEVRYRLLETLARYGRARLREAGDEKTLTRRHRDWYLRLAEQMAAEWFGPDQLEWARRLQREYLNLRAAMEYSLAPPLGEGRVGLRFTAALMPYWYGGCQLSEGRVWLERALASDREPTLARAMSLRNLASICAILRDFPVAEGALRECRALADHLHDPLVAAQTAATEAHLAVIRSDYATALDRATAALAFPGYAVRPERAALLPTLAIACALLGDYDGAASAFEEAQRCSAESGARFDLSWALVGRAIAALFAGENRAVIRFAREAMVIARDFHNALCISKAPTLLFCSTAADGDFTRGAVLLGVQRRICHALGVSGLANDAETVLINATTSQIRKELGERSFEAAVARGFALDLDEAIDYALGTEAEPAGAVEASTKAAEHSPLTAREQQVAELVSQGMSNKQIAADLVLSPRTVEGHVEHILAKLGLTSRAHIAAWIAHHRTGQD